MIQLIKSGYQVSVFTEENDGDYQMNVVINGLTKDDVEFIVKLCNIHTDPHGNNYYPSEQEISRYEAELTNLINSTYGHTFTIHIQTLDEVLQLAKKLKLRGCSDYYTRYFNSIEIAYLPHDAQLIDVTSEFV